MRRDQRDVADAAATTVTAAPVAVYGGVGDYIARARPNVAAESVRYRGAVLCNVARLLQVVGRRNTVTDDRIRD